ncbi:hypothetical protein F66182_2618 [Fusarium sp. NRRL 66182]|nr:hypothetical protein F66182_2618 [Fusarium sp. NRRL 66182]
MRIPSKPGAAGGGDDDGLAALKLSSFSDAPRVKVLFQQELSPPGLRHCPTMEPTLPWKWDRFQRLSNPTTNWTLLGFIWWTAAL